MQRMLRDYMRTSSWSASNAEILSFTREPTMTGSTPPFALPADLPSDLGRVRDYWASLKRGENSMPFWDDVNLSSLPDLSNRLMLVDAFENPQRFRLNSVGGQIRQRYGADLAGKFIDEIDAKAPFEVFAAQASATIEAKASTFFASEAGTAGGRQHGYARLLLPMWGDGRIGMMLGAIEDLA
jgi:hypothetical protein